MDKDEALKLALKWAEAHGEVVFAGGGMAAIEPMNEWVSVVKEALAQPAHSEWNAALDEAAARINNVRGFGQATQDSFAVFIKGLKKE